MAKNKTLKVLSTGTVAGMIAAAVLSSQAFAAVDAYSVKIGDDVLKYDKAALTESFLASKAGDAAPLYEDFTAKLAEAKGFYAFSDAKTGKFVSYNDIQAKFLEAKAAGEAFVVDNYTESATAEVIAVPTVKKVVVKDGKVVVEAQDGTTTPSTGVVSVSAINAPASSVATNAALVDVMTVKITAGSNDAKVNGLVLKRAGLSADTDITAVSVFDGSNRLNTPTILATSKADVTFNDSLVIPAGTTKELKVKVNIALGATPNNQFTLALQEVKAATGTTVNGTLPLTSNLFTISAVAIGQLTVQAGPNMPVTNKVLEVNSTQNILTDIRMSASREDIALSRLVLTQTGTASDEDLTNLKLYYKGEQIGETTTIKSRKAVFSLSTPVVIKNGEIADFTLKGDVKSGSSRTIIFDIADPTDIEAKGQTYGQNINTGNGTILRGNSQSIDRGLITVSTDTTTPATGTIPTRFTDLEFTVAKVEAKGEPVQLREVRLSLTAPNTAAIDDLTNIKIWANDTVIGTLNNFTLPAAPAATQTATVSLSNPIIVKPGEVVKLKVTATSQANGVTAGGYDIDIPVGGIGAVAQVSQTQLGSLAAATAPVAERNIPASNVDGNVKTATAITLNVTASSQLEAKTYAVGAKDVEFARYNISTQGSSDGVKVNAITVAQTGTLDNQDIQDLKLFIGDKQVGTTQQLNSSNVTFTLNDAIEITKGSVVTVSLKATASTTLNNTHTGRFDIPVNGIGYVGIASATAGTAPGLAVTTAPTMALATTGTLSLSKPADESQISSGVLVKASKAQKLSEIYVTASNSDVDVKGITITGDAGAVAHLSNFTLWDGDTQIGSVIPQLNASSQGKFTLTTPLTVQSGSSKYKTLVVKADVNDTTAAENQIVEVYVAAATDVEVYNAGTSTRITATDGNTSGTTTAATNTHDIRKTTLTAAKSTTAPSGTVVASTLAKVSEFTISADAKADAWIGAIKVDVTQGQASLNGQTVTLIREDNGQTIGTATFAGGTATVTIAGGSDDAASTGASSRKNLVKKGETIKVGVYANTSAVANGAVIRVDFDGDALMFADAAAGARYASGADDVTGNYITIDNDNTVADTTPPTALNGGTGFTAQSGVVANGVTFTDNATPAVDTIEFTGLAGDVARVRVVVDGVVYQATTTANSATVTINDLNGMANKAVTVQLVDGANNVSGSTTITLEDAALIGNLL